MLYDPKWEKTVKADPLSLTALIAWLEAMPPSETYCYSDSGHCLAAQYNKSFGRKYSPCSTDFDAPPSANSFDKVLEAIAVRDPLTFGAALERARFIQANDRWPGHD